MLFRSKGLLLGFLVGGIAGAVTALLFAPKPGKELREDIKQKSEDIKGSAKKMFSSLKKKGEQMYENMDDFLSETMEQTNKFSSAVKAGYETYQDERDRSS